MKNQSSPLSQQYFATILGTQMMAYNQTNQQDKAKKLWAKIPKAMKDNAPEGLSIVVAKSNF